MGNIKEKIIGIGIAIVFVFFIGYGIETFYPSPDYSDFCDENKSMSIYDNASACAANGGRWSDNARVRCIDEENCVRRWCDTDYLCRQDYENVREEYTKIVFIAALVLGLIVFVVGSVFLKNETVGPGLMGGGILTIVYGTIRYWGNMQDVGRFIMLGVALFVLIMIGYRIRGAFSFLKRHSKKRGRE